MGSSCCLQSKWFRVDFFFSPLLKKLSCGHVIAVGRKCHDAQHSLARVFCVGLPRVVVRPCALWGEADGLDGGGLGGGCSASVGVSMLGLPAPGVPAVTSLASLQGVPGAQGAGLPACLVGAPCDRTCGTGVGRS